MVLSSTFTLAWHQLHNAVWRRPFCSPVVSSCHIRGFRIRPPALRRLPGTMEPALGLPEAVDAEIYSIPGLIKTEHDRPTHLSLLSHTRTTSALSMFTEKQELTANLRATTPREGEKTSEHRNRIPVMGPVRHQDKMLRPAKPLSDFNIQAIRSGRQKTLRRPQLRFCR